MIVLVTGGTGYIGSNVVVALQRAGHGVVVADNLSNSTEDVLDSIRAASGIAPVFHRIDLSDTEKTMALFSSHDIDAVIHLAGLKAVGESVVRPLDYYQNNVMSTISLLRAMRRHHVRRLVFSSSATVYGSAPVPYREDARAGVGLTSPYGKTKYFIEELLRDESVASPDCEFTLLRYFNPIGADESGLLGEDIEGTPTNLMPYIVRVGLGLQDSLTVYGGDYPTPDGTCVRDYVHVSDVARGHVVALERSRPGVETFNLGSSRGTSVIELIQAFERANGTSVSYRIADRREGDLALFYADTTKANEKLGWSGQKSLEDMCRSALNAAKNDTRQKDRPS